MLFVLCKFAIQTDYTLTLDTLTDTYDCFHRINAHVVECILATTKTSWVAH